MNTASPEAKFIDQICAAPEQSEPRLVYADWLEERGKSDRARLIRMQVRISDVDARDDENYSLLEQIKQLETRVATRIMEEVQGVVEGAASESNLDNRSQIPAPVQNRPYFPDNERRNSRIEAYGMIRSSVSERSRRNSAEASTIR